ncbi:uncharacterized protein [Amphiura filiformis]|uniref:uncharacterized protein n=1 Tax=Amphiura filiformis TaxID=82378 RepID=UPI003B217B8D
MYAVLLVCVVLWQGIFAYNLEYVDAVYGGNARLTCEIPSNADCDDIRWSRYWETNPGLKYISTCTSLYQSSGLDRQRFSLSKHFSSITLQIQRVTQTDAGYTYRCSDQRNRNKKDVKIRIHTPVCSSSVIDEWSYTGQYEVQLNCTIEAPAQLTWYAPDMSQISKTINSSPNPTLNVTFNTTEPQNYLTFKCVATSPDVNQDPGAPASCTVTPLRIPPIVDIIPSTLSVTDGDNATFTCKSRTSYPKNTYTWLINGEPSSTRLNVKSEVDSSGASLTIMNVSTYGSNSTLKCRACNGLGEIRSSKRATLYVNAPVPTDMTVSSNMNDLPVSNVTPYSTTMKYTIMKRNSSQIETNGDQYVTVGTFLISIGLSSTLPVILVVLLGCYLWKRKSRKHIESKARPIEKPYTELDLSDVRRRDNETYMGISPSSRINSQPYESTAKDHRYENVKNCPANMGTVYEQYYELLNI